MKKIMLIGFIASLAMITKANAETSVHVCIPFFGGSGTYVSSTEYVVHEVPVQYSYPRPLPPPPHYYPGHFVHPIPPPPHHHSPPMSPLPRHGPYRNPMRHFKR